MAAFETAHSVAARVFRILGLDISHVLIWSQRGFVSSLEEATSQRLQRLIDALHTSCCSEHWKRECRVMLKKTCAHCSNLLMPPQLGVRMKGSGLGKFAAAGGTPRTKSIDGHSLQSAAMRLDYQVGT
eukprot:4665128-Amphidinium_carterae.1